MIRILIVDDHPMVREGLAAMLESEEGFAVVGLAANGEEAISKVAAANPDVILSDVRMPKLDGFAMLARLKGVKVLLLAGMPLKDEEQRARDLGAKGYLPKDVDQDRLSDVIREIAAKDDVFVCDAFQSAPSLLTARELDVLKHLSKGLQRDQIAAALGIGPESVKTHLKGIMVKLHAPNATSAVGRAFELGILRA